MPVALFITLGFNVLMAVIWTLPWLGWRWLQITPNATEWPALLAFSALWVLGEWSRSWLLTGFPWLYLGYAAIDTHSAQWGPLAGVYGISLVILLSSLCGWKLLVLTLSILNDSKTADSASARSQHSSNSALEQPAHQGSNPTETANETARYRAIWSCCSRHRWQLSGLIAVMIILFGVPEFIGVGTQALPRSISYALVQPDVSPNIKWKASERNTIINSQVQLSRPFWNRDLVIWPEAALPIIVDNNVKQAHGVIAHLKEITRLHSGTLITGILTKDAAASQSYNSIITIGGPNWSYNKRYLVPFGEYTPGHRWLGEAMRLFNMAPPNTKAGGADQPNLEIGPIKIAPSICYEIAFPSLVRAQSQDANLLLTISNDAWFGASIGPHQHIQIARMRALEQGKPLLRATNNGITAAITHEGAILQQLPQFHKGVLSGNLKPRSGHTLYSRFGDLPVLLICVAMLAVAVGARMRARKVSFASKSNLKP